MDASRKCELTHTLDEEFSGIRPDPHNQLSHIELGAIEPPPAGQEPTPTATVIEESGDTGGHQIACLRCGRVFVSFAIKMHRPSYCTKQCALRARWDRAKESRIARGLVKTETKEALCEVCSTTFFWTKKRGGRPKYCGVPCRRAAEERIKAGRRKTSYDPAVEHKKEPYRVQYIASAFAEGKSRREIAAHLGVSSDRVYRIAIRNNIIHESGVREKATSNTLKIPMVRELLEKGLDTREICVALNISHQSVERIIKKGELTRNRSKYRAQRKTKGAIPERDAILVECWPTGLPLSEIIKRCSSIPGPEFTENTVYNRVKVLKLKRPDWFKKEANAARNKRRRSTTGLTTAFKYVEKPPPRTAKYADVNYVPDDPVSDGWMLGGALIPVGRKWEHIRILAYRDGWELFTKHDLIGYNKSRQRRGKAPYAIADIHQHAYKWKD